MNKEDKEAPVHEKRMGTNLKFEREIQKKGRREKGWEKRKREYDIASHATEAGTEEVW
jgi:hypothetical protein